MSHRDPEDPPRCALALAVRAVASGSLELRMTLDRRGSAWEWNCGRFRRLARPHRQADVTEPVPPTLTPDARLMPLRAEMSSTG